MVLFILYVVLTFESVDEILWCYQSNETSSAVLSHGAIYLACSSYFWVCRRNPMVSPFKKYLFSSTFTYHYSLFCIFPKKLISAWWYLFFRVLRKEVRFSVHLSSVGTLGKENDICIRFLRGEDKIILTKKKVYSSKRSTWSSTNTAAGDKITHVAKLSLT